MSTAVYYFSGTGNSLHVARELQRRIAATRLVPLVRLAREDTHRTEAEAVGFVFPQYAGFMPKAVASVIRRLDATSAEYLFAVVTRGGTPCRAFGEMDELLRTRGRQLNAFFVITMPSGSEPLIESYRRNITAERIAGLESSMLGRLDEVREVVVSRREHRSEDLSGEDVPPPAFMAPFMPLIRVLTPVLLPLAKRAESRFRFYADPKCNGCGVCERVCLAGKIAMAGGRPAWQSAVACYGCFACLNYCPEQAIQIRSTWYLRSCTPTNGRYHHPDVTAADVASQKR